MFGVSEQVAADIVSKERPITDSIAFRLEEAIGVREVFWTALDANYRGSLSRFRYHEALADD